MEIRVTIAPDGKTQIESISALEDLWHDYMFFRSRAVESDQPSGTLTDALLAKRYYRAALLSLICYFEGVLNRWLEQLLGETDWRHVERKCIEKKVEIIGSRVASVESSLDICTAKKLRNTLVHLKPGSDGELYDKIDLGLLDETEKQVTRWLTSVEASIGLTRHPDTRDASRNLTEALGSSEIEGYTGQSE